jgi:IclR family transcriptional regulator, pca regulon regulatory protein
MAETGNPESGSYQVPSLERGLLILQMFRRDRRTLSMAEMAQELGVSVSSIYRIVQKLNAMNYLSKVGKSSYELAPQVLTDGFRYLASRDLVDIAMPHLNALRDRTSLSCHLSIRDQTDSLYIYRAFAFQRLSVNIPIGTRIPCHCSAMGRVLLSGLSRTELDGLYQHSRLDDYPLPAPKTLPELLKLIDGDRDKGWVLHRSDYSTAIASGVIDHSGRIVAAINLSGPEAVLDNADIQSHYRSELFDTAKAISRELGAAEV